MRLAFLGTPGFAAATLSALLAAGHEVAGVWSQPPRPAGRGQRPKASPVQALAESHGLPVQVPATLRTPEAQAAFAALGAEAAVVVAYGLILPPAVLAAPARGCLNVHASLLPRWRGAAPIHRAVMAGDARTGVTIMRMDEGLDTGPMLLSEALPIGPEDTAGDLHDRLAALGARLMVQALGRLDALPEAPQGAGATYAAKVSKEEGRVDWARPAAEVDRLVRGLSPSPGAWTEAGGERLRLLRSRLAGGEGAPGAVLPGEGLRVACGTGAVEVLEVQRPGGRALPVAEALRGWAPPGRLGA